MNLSKITLNTGSAPPSDLMRMKSIATFLGCSVPTVYRAMAHKGLPARRLGGVWVFSKDEVESWVKSLPGINLPNAS